MYEVGCLRAAVGHLLLTWKKNVYSPETLLEVVHYIAGVGQKKKIRLLKTEEDGQSFRFLANRNRFSRRSLRISSFPVKE